MSKFARASALVASTLILALALSQPARAEVCEDFAATAENDPESCRALWEKIGLPVSDANNDATIVCHTRYVLLHNNENKTPDWVIEPLTKKQVSGTFTRPEGKKFSSEKRVCPPARAKDDDYAGSKLDRGHQAASADFSSSGDLMDESFILSNAVPQVGLGFNRGIWKEFEMLVRKLTKDRGELYVITGPIYPDEQGKIPDITTKNNACKNDIQFAAPKKAAICDENDKDPKKKCDAGVAVPVGLFKIFYDPPEARQRLCAAEHRPSPVRGQGRTRIPEALPHHP